MSNVNKISQSLNIDPQQVAATIELLDDSNTIPFIARYRKEVTGGLDEEQIRKTRDLLGKLRALNERQETVLKTIEEQGALTPELKNKILEASTRTELEDLYQPYKPKRKTRASIARSRGLGPLAELIIRQDRISGSLDDLAQPYLSDGIPTPEEAWSGARDIVAETISDHNEVRKLTREKATEWGELHTVKIEKAEDPRGIYRDYYDFKLRVNRLRPHQILAINRGEKEKVLRVKVDIAERDWRYPVNTNFSPDHRSQFYLQFDLAAEDAASRLLLPAIERDIRRNLTELAETHAIQVFGDNLRGLLNQPPLSGHVVMGIDPGYRTGCKVAVVDPTGKPLSTNTIYPHPPQNQGVEAAKTLLDLVERYQVTLVAIGNGTASRETEGLVAALIQRNLGAAEGASDMKGEKSKTLHYLIVSEAGASVYSASKQAREELPGMDVSMRGAVSIARRVLDPLSELVKIDPKSIGVGMYQHDIDQKALGAALDAVVESVVNRTGVDVNAASPALLSYVSGIGPALGAKIVAHRDQHGPFRNRRTLLDVPGLGPKVFEQAAGFLRIRDGDQPLDSSAIHPESYPIANRLLQRAGFDLDTPPEQRQSALDALRSHIPLEELAAELGTGVPTLVDIFEQLVRPGRDPRQDLPAPILRSDVLKMEDLITGMQLNGTVRNVVDFGAFVDIGVKQDGLLHRSQIPRGLTLEVGNVIQVKILKVDLERGRISLGWL